MNDGLQLAVDAVFLIIAYFVFFFKRLKSAGFYRLITGTLMYIYICAVLFVTVMPVITSLPFIFNHSYSPMNLYPFIDYIYGRGDALRQIILNMIMMMPFGFFLPLLKKRRLPLCVLYTFIFSLCIELIQPLLSGSRSSDITDIITNTLGGCLGYIIGIPLRPLYNSILNKISDSRVIDKALDKSPPSDI